MSVSGEFYLEQATLCASSAAAANLSNQRDTLLRACAAWQALADREFKVKAARELRALEVGEQPRGRPGSGRVQASAAADTPPALRA